MNNLSLSRGVYASPFLLFFAYYVGKMNLEIIGNSKFVLAASFWGVAFLFSLVLFRLPMRSVPSMLVHFTFLVDFASLSVMASASANPVFFLFVLPSSFSVLESLRGNFSGILFHLLIFGSSFAVLWIQGLFSALGFGYTSAEALRIFAMTIACIVCRGIVSATDDAAKEKDSDVLGGSTFQNHDSISEAPSSDESLHEAEETVGRLEKENGTLKELVLRMKEKLDEGFKRKSDELLEDSDESKRKELERRLAGMAGYYESFIQKLLCLRGDERMADIQSAMQVLASSCSAGYAGLFTIKSGSLQLANFSNVMDIGDMDAFISSGSVQEGIRECSTSRKPVVKFFRNGLSPQFHVVREIIFVPHEISGRTSIVMMCFDHIDESMIRHYCNLATLASEHIAGFFRSPR